VNAIFGKPLTYFYPSKYKFLNFLEFQKKEGKKFTGKIQESYKKISIKKLKKLKQKFDIQWFISDGVRKDLNPIYCNQKYCLIKL
jgi:hypothetical protein